MRSVLYVGALLALAALAPQLATSLLDTAAATLLETMPFAIAAAVLARLLPMRNAGIVPFVGCGCSAGAAARSIPAAVAVAFAFGPAVAACRLAAAIAIDRLRRNRPSRAATASTLDDLQALVPCSIGAAALWGGLSALPSLQHASPVLAGFAGAAAAFVSAPCGFGTPAIAAALRQWTPAASAGFLCVAGIFDARVFRRAHRHEQNHDCFAYTLAALACALTALHSGAGLVHPLFTIPLWLSSGALAILAVRFRRAATPPVRVAPALMLAAAIFTAPPPAYHATQTTMADAFAGERIDFTGMLTTTGRAVTIVRYAITCCRADAAPVVLRLDNPPRGYSGWAHVRGMLEVTEYGLALRVRDIRRIPPPADPFLYR